MIEIIKIFIFFIIPANILLAFFLEKKNLKLDNKILVLFSYGVAPLIGSLLFRYSVFIFPGRSGYFYLLFFFSFWIFVLVFSFPKIVSVINLYKKIFYFFKNWLTMKKVAIILPFLSFFILFLIQSLFYPIVSGDSAYYVNQSEAIFEYKNIDWEKNKGVIIRGGDEYSYNPMIRPGIPYFVALSNFLFNRSENYFTIHFFNLYYYVFLYLIFITIVFELAEKLKKLTEASLFFGTCFFIFNWGLTRVFILNDKESVIYFLGLLSVYLIYKLSKEKRKISTLAVMSSMAIGLNSFINPHGIIISVALFLLLFLFSKLRFINRIWQLIFVFISSIFFGGFEFILNFFGMFMFFVKEIRSFFAYGEKIIAKKSVLNNFSTESEPGPVKMMHAEMFQIKNLTDIYLKGKLQIYTKIGIFGYGFWFFSAILILKLKEILKLKFSKFIFFFICIYFFLVIDPFNINKHPLAIVLWGDDKYAKMILLLSLIFVSAYFYDFLSFLYLIISKFKRIFSVFSFLSLFCLVFFSEFFKKYILELLLLTVPTFKNIDFYSQKIGVFFNWIIIFVILFCFVLVFLYFKKNNQAKMILTFSFVLFFIITPFFIVNVGKVPLLETFNYLTMDNDSKLRNILNNEGKYDVYFYAKKTLPKNVLIRTTANELYLYNDYFRLTRAKNKDIIYEIERECSVDWEEIYSNINFKLCKNKS